MLLYLHSRSSVGPNDPGMPEAIRRAKESAKALAASRYPAIRRAFALQVSGNQALTAGDPDDGVRGSQTPMVPRTEAPALRSRILRPSPFSNFPPMKGFGSRHSGAPTSPGCRCPAHPRMLKRRNLRQGRDVGSAGMLNTIRAWDRSVAVDSLDSDHTSKPS
jgi:hypothetical protein